MVPGGRDCLWRDSRQLGGVAGGSTRSPVETLDRTTRKKIARLRDLMTSALSRYLHLISLQYVCASSCPDEVKVQLRSSLAGTWIPRYIGICCICTVSRNNRSFFLQVAYSWLLVLRDGWWWLVGLVLHRERPS